jgi:hypothetical protein
MTWENYFDSNRAFTIILQINAALHVMDTESFNLVITFL